MARSPSTLREAKKLSLSLEAARPVMRGAALLLVAAAVAAVEEPSRGLQALDGSEKTSDYGSRQERIRHTVDELRRPRHPPRHRPGTPRRRRPGRLRRPPTTTTTTTRAASTASGDRSTPIGSAARTSSGSGSTTCSSSSRSPSPSSSSRSFSRRCTTARPTAPPPGPRAIARRPSRTSSSKASRRARARSICPGRRTPCACRGALQLSVLAVWPFAGDRAGPPPPLGRPGLV